MDPIKDQAFSDSDETRQLDALFFENLPEIEIDTQRMWWEMRKRLDAQQAPVGWKSRLTLWIEHLMAGSGDFVYRLKPAVLAAGLALLAFSTWVVRDQTAHIEQWQLLIQIDKEWSGNTDIHPAADENPFVLSEENNSGANPFDNLTS